MNMKYLAIAFLAIANGGAILLHAHNDHMLGITVSGLIGAAMAANSCSIAAFTQAPKQDHWKAAKADLKRTRKLLNQYQKQLSRH